MFNGGFREASEKSATLPEDAFDLFAGWIHTNRVQSFTLYEGPDYDYDVRLATDENIDRMRVCCLAENLCLPSLMNSVMDMIVDHHIKQKHSFSAEFFGHGLSPFGGRYYGDICISN